ncbi:helix-loop-helix dna-binding domain containing protein 2 [Dermatophagoides farinae]|uniref:Helix-loop-helix dna-binding domain containing protein 2 n=1 Tax=Dermatophagoides farinae TaxID=6954 RepID=A0A9D4P965_DERFA|nr:helix-loop-helix dna-binding domain containing protein 2 [Dermatophagoides farinae]
MARFNNKNKKQKSPPTTTTTIPAAKNAERERGRVRCLRNAFQTLQQCLPSVPPNTKLSKLDILILATNYIQILMQILDNNNHNNHVDENGENSTTNTTTTTPEYIIHQHNHHSIDYKQSTTLLNIDEIENSLSSKVYRPIKVKIIFLC